MLKDQFIETLPKDMEKSGRLIWVDLEMTGLDIEKDHIIEMACIITDKNLEILQVGPDMAIHQPKSVMDGMGEWCIEHHGKSGLTKRVLESGNDIKDVEQIMLDFVAKHTEKGKCQLAGNSVHADKRFLDKFMPLLMKHVHYRIVDVSTIKELCRRWYPTEYANAPQKKETHRALDDIKESIDELQYYRKTIFKNI